MFSKNLRRALVLGSVSSIALAGQAHAAGNASLTNVRYEHTLFGACRISVDVYFDHTANDVGNEDFTEMALTDGLGNDINPFSYLTAQSGSSFNSLYFTNVYTALNGTPELTLFEYSSFSRQAPLASAPIDFAQMHAAGGECARVATASGFTAPNSPPVADAGSDNPDTTPNTVISLDATGTTDPDGDPLTYRWQQVSGPNVTINNANSANASFTAPGRIGFDNTLVFQVIVDDPNGGTDTDSVSYTILTGQAPTASAGPDQTLPVGTTVTLDGSASSDPDGDPLTYTWFQLAGPAVTLTNASSSTPSFTIPANAPTNQEYRFELTVDDGTAGRRRTGSETDLVSIYVAAPANSAPNADAGPNQTAARGDNVQLDASATTDPDNDPLTYSWQQTGGPSVTLSSPNSVSPSFTAPNVDSRGAVLTFEVTASDPDGATSTDTVELTIPGNSAPTPDAGTDQTAQGGTTVTLDGSGSTDPEGDTITYSWGQTSGSPVTLIGDTTASPTFVAPAATSTPQTLVFSLVVDDGIPNPPNSLVQIDQVTITIPAAPLNGAPVANAGTSGNITGGATIVIDATDSTDPENDPLTYSWTQVSGPVVTIADPNPASGQTTFVAPAQTNAQQVLEFEVAVSDGISTSRDTVTYTIAANRAPFADAGVDDAVTPGQLVNLAGGASLDPDGDTLTAQWRQVSGTSVNIANANSLQATFTAPAQTAVRQTLVFELEVTDPLGLSNTAQVTFSVAPNAAPVASGGADQTVRGGEVVSLDGSASSDPEGDTLTYSWVQTGGPSVTLSNPNIIRPTFTAPTGLSATTPITFELTVDDGLATNTDTVVINVLPNSAPTADAGADIGPIDSGQTVTLDGSGSSDPDGDALTYSWTQTSGTSVTLSDPGAVAPNFTAPLVNGTETFEFQLSVSDGVFTRTDTVRVTVQALGTVTIVTNVVGADETVSFNTNVPGLASSVTTSGGTGTITAADVTAGSYSFAVNDLRAAGYALTGISCNDTDSSVSLQNGTVALELSPSESLVCTIELTDTRTAAEQAIGEFLGGRNALLMANQPDLQRRLERLSGQSAGGGSAQIGQVAVPGSGALPANIRINSANRSISTSLAMVQTALGRREGQSDFDIWFEGSLADVTIGNNRGTFAIAYGGVDYLITPDVLVGALVQFDRFSNDADVLGAGQAEGDGWMAGPYITARLAPGFFVDARVAFGSSDNTVSPFGTYVDGFETDRMLASASAIGDIELGEGLTFWPELSVRYLREDVAGYVDTLGVAIPDARIDQGEVAFSPRLDYRVEDENGWAYAPYGQIEGVLTFGADTYSVVENGLRARGSLGVDVVSPGNVRFGIAGFYDGIGEDRFEATGVTVTLSFGF